MFKNKTYNLCAIIDIDICRTINKKNKLVHSIPANAMGNCFNEIEIPYSIVIFSDYAVNLLLKNLRSLIQKK